MVTERHRMHGEMEDLMKKEVIFSCLALFCMSLYTSPYGAMTDSILCLNVGHLSKMVNLKEAMD
jgi:hypothetical protein